MCACSTLEFVFAISRKTNLVHHVDAVCIGARLEERKIEGVSVVGSNDRRTRLTNMREEAIQ